MLSVFLLTDGNLAPFPKLNFYFAFEKLSVSDIQIYPPSEVESIFIAIFNLFQIKLIYLIIPEKNLRKISKVNDWKEYFVIFKY